jgi:hypothetical protein
MATNASDNAGPALTAPAKASTAAQPASGSVSTLPRPSSALPGVVRPYVRRVRARVEDPSPALIKEIMLGQETFHSRATKCDEVVQIFHERFMFHLTAKQEMGFIALFAESKPMVDQFFSFTEEQREIFVVGRKADM